MAGLIGWLAYDGARTSAGAAVASGNAYFYVPGSSTTQVDIWSDADETAPLSQPVTLDAAGKAAVWVRAQCTVAIQTSAGVAVTEKTRSNSISADQVEIMQAGFTGVNPDTGSTEEGGRTDLTTYLANEATSKGGVDGYYKAVGATTSRTMRAAIGRWISPSDFGAAGTGTSDDATAFQACITNALSTGKSIWVEPGTYAIYSALTASGSTARGLVIEGANPWDCIIKNFGTTTAALSIDLSSAIESYIVIKNLLFSANTTSSAAAISAANGNGLHLERVTTSLHRIGFDVSAVSHAFMEHCLVLSTDDNASGIGFKMGAFSTAMKCRVTAATAGVGFSMGAADAQVMHCYAGGCATGISLGAVARGVMTYNRFGTNTTTDLAINASASNFVEIGNTFASIADSSTGLANTLGWLTTRRSRHGYVLHTVTGSSTETFDITVSKFFLVKSAVAGAFTTTVAATATTGLIDGQELTIMFRQAGNNTQTVTWNAQFANPSFASLATNTCGVVMFHWDSTSAKWRNFPAGLSTTPQAI